MERALERATAQLNETDRTAAINQFFDGVTDANGTRTQPGVWDDVSQRLAQNATGNVRTIVAPDASPNSVFSQTELKALLANSNVTHIDGTPKADLIRLSNAEIDATQDAARAYEQVRIAVTAQSTIYSSNLSVATDAAGTIHVGTGKFFAETPHISEMKIPAGMQGVQTFSDLPTKLPSNAMEVLQKAGQLAEKAGVPRLLNKLGILGDALGLFLAANSALAASEAGDSAHASAIMTDWAGGFAGGLLGGLAAAKLAAMATLPLHAAGPAGSLVAGVIVLGAGFAGSIWGDEAGRWIASLVGNLFSSSQAATQRRDPLTLDLDGDGLETVGINTAHPILFDHDADGVKTATGWIKPDDGFLVLDRNGNGTIDSGEELFGDSTPLLDNDGNIIGKAEDGFAALAQEDTNNDGLVDVNDAHFANLRIWRDLNSDGISQADELLTMDQAGIAAIKVDKTEHTQLLPNGNQLADLGTFIRTDGSTGGLGEVTAQMGDIDLAENTFISQFTDSIPLTEQTEQLPIMDGSGRVRSIQEAASLSPAVAVLLAQYAGASTRAEQLALLDQLIIEWGKTSDLAVTGEGAYDGLPTTVLIAGQSTGSDGYNTWMTRLQTLERFNGRPFATATVGTESITVNLFSERLFFLNQSWDALRQSVYDGLLLQTRLKIYLDAISLSVDENSIGLDFSDTAQTFQSRYDQLPAEAVRDLLDLQRIAGTDLNGMGWDGYGQLRNWLAEATTTTDPSLQTSLVAALSDFGYPGLRVNGDGTSSSEVVIGSDDGALLYGNAGNDLLLGGNGDDVLNGGSGNDILYGGAGNDTYRFNLADGVDTIIESHGDVDNDSLEFGAGFLAGDITITQNGDKLVFSHANGRDSISIANWFDSLSDSVHRLDTISFADGSSFDLNALQVGTDDADTLVGTESNDIILGNAGDDTLAGAEGNDWLDGGSGADQMAGGAGNDIYVVDNAADVTVEDIDGGIDTVDAKVSYTLADNVENLRLAGFSNISGTGNQLDNTISGNAADNTLSGMAGNDTLIGNGGSDSLYGGDDDDLLDAGTGNDWLDGGSGSDTMLGGSGNDTYVVESTGDSVSEYASQGIDTVNSSIDYTLNANVENLNLTGTAVNGTGNELDNVITGNMSDNTLAGLAGNDTLDGGAGADTMLGGTGNDTYIVDNIGDTAVELSDEGIDTVKSSITWALADNVENLTLTGTSVIDGTGNELDNTIIGNAVDNRLTGLVGNDTLDGGAGADTMLGGTGNVRQ